LPSYISFSRCQRVGLKNVEMWGQGTQPPISLRLLDTWPINRLLGKLLLRSLCDLYSG
jgi:hypothetical protein